MAKKYTKKQTTEILNNSFKQKYENLQPMDVFYSLNIVNWKGKTPLYDETQEYYSEIISEYLLKKNAIKNLSKEITELTRIESYDTDESNVKTSKQATNKRLEEKLAKEFYESSKDKKKTYGELGLFIKHQMALKDYIKGNVRAGKVDLVSYNEDTNTVYLIEFKRPDNTESILRAGLEAFTYKNQLNKKKFCDDFAKRLSGKGQTKFVPAILVYENSAQYNNYEKEDRPQTRELLKELEIECFFIKGKDKIYKAPEK